MSEERNDPMPQVSEERVTEAMEEAVSFDPPPETSEEEPGGPDYPIEGA